MIALRGMHSSVRPYAEYAMKVAQRYGINPVVTSVTRSLQEQAELRANFERCVAQGRFPSEPDCKWPANRPGDSAHNFGVAFDSWVPPEQMRAWTIIRRWVGFRVPDNDSIHAELPNWRSYLA